MTLKTAIASILLATACITATNAQAAIRHDLDIPAQELGSALVVLAQQARIQVVYSADLVQGYSTHGLSGSMTHDEALNKLLAKTGLKYEFLDEQTVTLSTASSTGTAPSAPGSSGGGAGKGVTEEASKSIGFWNRLRLAQSDNPSLDEGKKETPGGSDKNFPDPSIDEIVVTGTHIRGVAPISPIIVLDRAYIERSGKSSLADVIRTLPQNFNGGGNVGNIAAGTANSNGTDASRINLRGLGSGSTLVLVNGHRLAFSSTSGGPDISGIPLAAVERIDVLTDGASALYGSDAVAGVVNIKLSKSYDGAETKAYIGDTTEGGGLTQQYSQLLGAGWNGGGALLNFEYADDEGIDRSQRDFSRELSDSDYSLQPVLNRRSAFLSIFQELSSRAVAHLEGLYSNRNSRSSASLASVYSLATQISAEQHMLAAGVDIALAGSWSLALSAQQGRNVDDLQGHISFFPDPTEFPVTHSVITNKVTAGEAILTGRMFDLPSGPVKLAAGGGYRKSSIDYVGAGFDPASRSSTYAFSEARVPLIANGAVASDAKLEAVLAGRYEDFNDFGSSFSPKLALLWHATDTATVRVGWGRSFRAPDLYDQYGPVAVDLKPIDPPQDGRSSYLILGLANRDLTAETSTAWNISVEYQPEWARGLQMTLAAYQIQYRDRIDNPFFPETVAIADQQTYAPYFALLPTEEQQQQAIDSGIFQDQTGQPYDPANVAFILDSRVQNISRVEARGLDIQLAYDFALSGGDIGTFLSASWMKQDQFAFPMLPGVEKTNFVFNPPRFRTRAGATWTQDELALSGILNYTDSYANNVSAIQTHIGSWTTMDMQLSYKPQWSGMGSGLRLNLTALNVFDSDPPDVAADTFLFSGDVGFDSTNATATGRMIALEVTKSW